MKSKINEGASHAVLTPVDFDPFAAEATEVEQFPMTEAQREIWAAVQMGQHASCAYNQCFPLRLQGAFSLDSMHDAIQKLIARHEALRLVCDSHGETQTVLPVLTISVPVVDIMDQPPAEREAQINARLQQETETPFDLTRGPLVRAQIIREAADCHLVVFTAHHIACDGWSSGILLQELAILYEAERYGLSAHLPPAGRFRDFVHYQATNTYQAAARAAESYWQAQFTGATVPDLDFPLDRPRPPSKTYHCAQQRRVLNAALYQNIKRVAAKHGCTVYALLLAAYQTFLHRLTGQTDFVLGIPVAMQAQMDGQTLVGHGTNLLPLRVQLNPEDSFAHHLRNTRAALLNAQEHQAITFGSLIRVLNLARDPSRTPLVSAIFNVDKVDEESPFQGLTAELLPSPKRFASFEVEANIIDTGKTLIIECNYNTDLFESQTIQRWLGHYQTVLAGVTKDPDQQLWQLPLLSSEEHAQLLYLAQAETSSFTPKQCLHHLFESQVERTPDAVAVSYEGRTLTYRELNRYANQLARQLLAAGVGPETLVGLYVERSLEMVIGILSILKAGGAYLPIDPSYPAERTAFMIADAAVPVLLTQPALRSRMPASQAQVIMLTLEELQEATLLPHADTNPASSVQPDHLAYVIYTSGSTGIPKGVLITHANVVRLLHATEEWFQFSATDVWSMFHSYAFDFSVWELWGALSYGGRLIVVPYWVSRSPETFAELLRQEQVTVLNQTPSAFRQLIPFMTATTPTAPTSLRYIIFGGEALEVQSLQPWLACYGDEQPRLINMYGITETTVHVTYRPITWTDLHAGAGSVIGQPIPDLSVYVLDQHQQPAPIGVVGEMYIGGAGVARGYLHRPALTQERFLPNPFHPSPDARLYRSGDLARRLPNGDLEYLGRIDQQVKIRGFRVELGEIEAVLHQHPAIQEAVVVACKEDSGDKRLVAYCVTTQSTENLDNELRNLLQRQVPDYMMPAAFVWLPALPLTSNGKVDRSALPAPNFTRSTSAREYVAPRTPTEKTLANIWQAVLKLPAVGIHDNFFTLGGHSILAAQLLTRLQTTFAIELPLPNLFKAPTISELALVIESLLWNTHRPQTAEASAERIEIEL